MGKPRVGIIGAGRLGTALGRLLSGSGYDVSIINSKGLDSLELQLSIMMPGVTAREVEDLISYSDIIILAVPLPRYTQLPLEQMAGKIVIDAMNYWAPVDGSLPEFDAYAGSSSELVAQSIPGATVIKTLNSVAYGELEEHALPLGAPGRRAIPLAGDDSSAKELVATLINDIGFDPVDLGSLSEGMNFQPDTPLFNRRCSKNEIS